MAHYCLHKLKKWPSEYLALPRHERAFVIASIQVKIDAEKEAEKKTKQKANKGRAKKRR